MQTMLAQHCILKGVICDNSVSSHCTLKGVICDNSVSSHCTLKCLTPFNVQCCVSTTEPCMHMFEEAHTEHLGKQFSILSSSELFKEINEGQQHSE